MNLDYWQKKTYLHFVIFKKNFFALPFGKKLNLFLLLFIIISYPGQNRWQTLTINPGPVRAAVDLTLRNNPLPFSDGAPAPKLTAHAAYVFDPDSGTVLFGKSQNAILFPASTTKIMTALVALDNYDLHQVLTVNNYHVIGNTIKLVPGEQFTVENLLATLLIASANDAALALADNYKGGYPQFVELMNQKATELHLTNTHYSNVSGIESQDHQTTAHDLAILTKEAIKNPFFLEYVGTKSTTITDASDNHQYLLESTNELLGKVEGLKGVKTGWTELAGECLVTLTERDGKKIIIVVLNSQNRFAESENLIEWAYSHHTWQEI